VASVAVRADMRAVMRVLVMIVHAALEISFVHFDPERIRNTVSGLPRQTASDSADADGKKPY